MRTLAIVQNCSIDGSTEMLDSWFDPQAQADDADLIEENHRQDAAADALLVGRDTFISFRDYWRDLPDDRTGISDYLNGVDKYVVSSTLTDPAWTGTTILGTDWLEQVQRLKEQPGKDIVCTGSIGLTHALLTDGLVDEIRLFVYPYAQGRGRRLTPDGFTRHLDLMEARAFRNGVVLQRYRVV